MSPIALFTIGFTGKSAEEFFELLATCRREAAGRRPLEQRLATGRLHQEAGPGILSPRDRGHRLRPRAVAGPDEGHSGRLQEEADRLGRVRVAVPGALAGAPAGRAASARGLRPGLSALQRADARALPSAIGCGVSEASNGKRSESSTYRRRQGRDPNDLPGELVRDGDAAWPGSACARGNGFGPFRPAEAPFPTRGPSSKAGDWSPWTLWNSIWPDRRSPPAINGRTARFGRWGWQIVGRASAGIAAWNSAAGPTACSTTEKRSSSRSTWKSSIRWIGVRWNWCGRTTSPSSPTRGSRAAGRPASPPAAPRTRYLLSLTDPESDRAAQPGRANRPRLPADGQSDGADRIARVRSAAALLQTGCRG